MSNQLNDRTAILLADPLSIPVPAPGPGPGLATVAPMLRPRGGR